jgi:hypothetical protein
METKAGADRQAIPSLKESGEYGQNNYGILRIAQWSQSRYT